MLPHQDFQLPFIFTVQKYRNYVLVIQISIVSVKGMYFSDLLDLDSILSISYCVPLQLALIQQVVVDVL